MHCYIRKKRKTTKDPILLQKEEPPVPDNTSDPVTLSYSLPVQDAIPPDNSNDFITLSYSLPTQPSIPDTGSLLWIGDLTDKKKFYSSNNNPPPPPVLEEEPFEETGESVPIEPSPLPPGSFDRTQYTPNYTNVSVLNISRGCPSRVYGAAAIEEASARGRMVSGGTMGHSPDLITWISPRWNLAPDSYKWDGIPFFSSNKLELRNWLFPGRYQMRGLREHYYSFTPEPFLDPYFPTVGEIDNWNIEVIRHFRKLIGNTTPLNPDRCLFLRAQWNNERKYSNYWDNAYPGTFGTASGPCINPDGTMSTDAHCGATFIPNSTDQIPYLEGGGTCSTTGGSEGIRNIKKDLPWSIRMSEIIYLWLTEDGLSGHTGPFLSRTRVGFGFHCWNDLWLVFRGKWSG